MNKKIRLQILTVPVLLGLGLLHFAGPAAAQGEDIAPGVTIIEIPDNRDDATVIPGETIVAKARVYVYQGIRLQSRIDARQRGGSGAGRPTVAIEPQYLVARTEDRNWTYYAGNVIYRHAGVSNVTGELGSGGLQNRVGGLRIRKDDPEDIEVWVRGHRGRGFYIEEPLEYESATIGAGDELNTAEELVYGGIDGDTLRIIYREHAGTSAEPVTEKGLRLDLTSSSVVTAEGASIEVLSADPDSLNYRVLQNFE